jgi:hypothetical protein
MDCAQVLERFPQASSAYQTRTTVRAKQPVGGGGDGKTGTITGERSQLSEAVGIPKDGMAGQSIVKLAGQVIVGDVMSWTDIVWAHVLELFPQASVEYQIR